MTNEQLKRIYFKWHYDHQDAVPADIADWWLTKLTEAKKEAWIDGFMTSAEGYNGEYLGSYLTKGRTIRETVIKDIYDSEHNLIKEDEV